MNGKGLAREGWASPQLWLPQRVLVTGVAGFIGMHVAERLLTQGVSVWGVDDLNTYYDPALKQARLRRLQARPGFVFEQGDVADAQWLMTWWSKQHFEAVIHLAAQVGVRAAATQPQAYAQANLGGFLNVLEGCRQSAVRHVVYASSSSVYGANRKLPASEHDPVDHPLSLYAATKRANELMAHSYSHGFNLPSTGLRLFTVYGPWGRPDMAPHRFVQALLAGEPLPVFHQGEARRDFTFIDDVVEAVWRVLCCPPPWGCDVELRQPSPARSTGPFRILNVGHSRAVSLSALIEALSQATGRVARCALEPAHTGDVLATWADGTELAALTGFRPSIALAQGVERYVAWFRAYYAA